MPLHVYKLLNQMFRACGGERLPRFDRVRFFLTDEIFDQSRARDELGYLPKVSLKEAIHQTAKWYWEHGYLSS
jgi:nucleoside-diphosphate-sugar epimerase